MANLPPTVFCDIDGTLIPFIQDFTLVASRKFIDDLLHSNEFTSEQGRQQCIKSARKLVEWHSKGVRIILVTGRPESMREVTISQLYSIGAVYDQLIMNCGTGKRFLINDSKDKQTTAFGICIDRNLGIGEINLDEYASC